MPGRIESVNLSKGKILAVCPSRKYYRPGDNVDIYVRIKNTSTESHNFGVKAKTTRFEKCKSSVEIGPNIGAAIPFTWTLTDNENGYIYDIGGYVYSNTNCTGLLDQKVCREIIYVDKRILFKGESKRYYSECSPSRDGVYYRVIAYYYIYYDNAWHNLGAVSDTGWKCCANSNQWVKQEGYVIPPLSNDKVEQLSNISIGTYFWKSGDPTTNIQPTCWDNDCTYIYGGSR